jgi:hypothetical protein
VIAPRLGDAGFVHYLHELRRLRVLSRGEVIAWMGLHGAVTRLEPPLDDGNRLDEEALAELERELGA